ncbi:MAG: methyltransferase domain-containing protein [Thermoleophilia bacterium]
MPMTLATATCVCGGVHLEAADELPPDPRLPYPVAHPTSHGAVSRCLACGHVTIDDAHRDAERAVGEPVNMLDRISAFAEWWAPQLRHRTPTAIQFGAGRGRVAAALAADGWRVRAADTSADDVEFIRGQVGIDADLGSPDSLMGLGQFDLVVLVGMLEYEDDPGRTLSAAVRFVAPGGFVYSRCPTVIAPGSSLVPDGLRAGQRHAFTRTSISVLVAEAGVSSLRMEHVREADARARFAVCCAVAEPAGRDDERRGMRQIAVADPTGPAAAWAAIEDPTPAGFDPEPGPEPSA